MRTVRIRAGELLLRPWLAEDAPCGLTALRRIEGRAEVGNDAPLRVAEKAGFTFEGVSRQALRTGDRRRDCWVGSLVEGDSA